jgi:hypothetical protein
MDWQVDTEELLYTYYYMVKFQQDLVCAAVKTQIIIDNKMYLFFI